MVGTSKSGNRGPKQNLVPLYLDHNLQQALAKLELMMDLDRAYAAYQAFLLGCRELKVITEEEYVFYKKRYGSPPLSAMDEIQKSQTPDELLAKQKLEGLNRYFGQVLKQWDDHQDPKWREKMLEKAEKDKELPNAQALLKKIITRSIGDKGT